MDETKSGLIYPPDLAHICQKHWDNQRKAAAKKKSESANQSGISEPPFPTHEHTLELIETVYNLSFLLEEGRRVGIRVMYLTPEMIVKNNDINIHSDPVRLEQKIPLSVGDLLKLAPAVQANESAILIGPASEETGTGGRGLVIWGILHLGADWFSLLTNADSAAVCPPNCLTISSFSPGYLNVSVGGHALARLRGGRLVGLPLPELDGGKIGAFLNPAAQELYRDTTKVLKVDRYSVKDDSDRHPFHSYYRTLTRLLHLIREQRHGGALLILPDELNPSDGRLVDRLSIKYRVEFPSVWQNLIDEGVASKNYFEKLFIREHEFLYYTDNATAPELKELIMWEKKKERSLRKIEEFCSFVASLSAVDGAVVMTRKMRVLGFGAEITELSPSLHQVKEALDPEISSARSIPIERYGTRHRSAMRMCSSFEDCVALVVSQDGPVKAIKRVGPDVVMWNDATLRDITL